MTTALPDSPADSSPLPDVIDGQYRVLNAPKRGRGAATYLCTDLARGTTVVVKRVAFAALSATARMRLEYEARVLSQIKTGRLAPLLELRLSADRAYLVMPFVPGVPLRSRLCRGPLRMPEAVALGRGVLAALAAAHACGVLHRAVRPSNIVVNDGPT